MATEFTVLLLLLLAAGARGGWEFYEPSGPDACAQSCAGRCGEGRPHQTTQCLCDSLCSFIGDCCSDVSVCESVDPNPASSELAGLLECRSVHLDERTLPGWEGSVWMVSACPVDWMAGRSDQLLLDTVNNCSRGSSNLPLVTDLDTGLVYKNEYCAVCNNVSNFRQWMYSLECGPGFADNLREGHITPEDIESQCIPCGFSPPRLRTLPRYCIHSRLTHSACLEGEALQTSTGVPIEAALYQDIVNQCQSGQIAASLFELGSGEVPIEGVEENRISRPFRNRYCAICNGFDVSESLQTCVNPYDTRRTDFCHNEALDLIELCPPPVPGTEGSDMCTQVLPFTVIMDVGRDSQNVRSEFVSTSIPTSCSEQQVFDPLSQTCRNTFCPEAGRGQSCAILQNITQIGLTPLAAPVPDITLNITVNDTRNVTENDSISTGQPFLPFCGGQFIILDDSEFTLLENGTTLLYGGETFEIVGFANGSAVVCTNFSQNGTIEVNTTVYTFSYPGAFSILTYVGTSLSVVGCVFVLLTYSLFRELRTLPGKILMNLSAAILATSIFILIGIPLFALSERDEVCQTTAIFLHWVILSQFSWMTIMSYELARTMIRGARLRQSESKKGQLRVLFIYLLIGWGLPSIITLLAIIINFSTDYVDYGEDGFCWIGDTNSFYALVIVPVIVGIILNIATFSVTSYLLFRAQRGEAKLQQQKSTSYMRIYLSVFSITGLTWLFGFVAILARDDWAWYLFIIFNSSQGFTICLAFLFTLKVFSFYKKIFWPKIHSLVNLSQLSKRGKTVSTELGVKSSTNSSSKASEDNNKPLATTKGV